MWGISRKPKGARTDRLKCCTTNCFKITAVGVEYISPQQQGGIYGTIYRQFLTTSLPAALTSGSIVTRLVDYCLVVDDASNRHTCKGWFDDGTNEAGIALSGTSGGGNLSLVATGLTVQSGWVDYTKV